jgi:predicted MFS family arabinose efflux permease
VTSPATCAGEAPDRDDAEDAIGPVAAPAADSSTRPAGVAVHRWGGILWQRDFRLLWVGETTSSAGTSVTAVALPLVAVTTLHASTLLVGVLAACTWLPWLVIGLPAGAWVDRLPRRPVMLACDAASMLALASVPVAAWYGDLAVDQLVAVALIAGTAAVFFSTAYSVYLPDLIDADDLAEGNATLQASRSAAQIAGPGAAGLLARLCGPVTGLLADAITFMVSAGCLAGINRGERATGPARPRTRLIRQVAAGLRLVAGDPYFRTLAIRGALGNLALTGWQALDVVFLIRVVGLGTGTVGLLLALLGIGGVLGAVLARPITRRFGTSHGMLLSAIGTAPFGLLVPLTAPGPRLLLFPAAGAIVSAGVVASNVISRSFRQLCCPAPLLGRLTATTSTLAYGAMPLGALLAGILGSQLGARPALWAMTGALLASAGILLIGPTRRHRDLPTTPSPALIDATAHATSTT